MLHVTEEHRLKLSRISAENALAAGAGNSAEFERLISVSGLLNCGVFKH